MRAQELTVQGFAASASSDLEAACAQADIISCATLSRDALVLGKWLKPGVHVDLIGAYTREMRETDAGAVSKTSVFVDTMHGAESNAGDLIHAAEEGVFEFTDIRSDLAGLVRNNHPGRVSDDEITLFKSVGAAC